MGAVATNLFDQANESIHASGGEFSGAKSVTKGGELHFWSRAPGNRWGWWAQILGTLDMLLSIGGPNPGAIGEVFFLIL